MADAEIALTHVEEGRGHKPKTNGSHRNQM